MYQTSLAILFLIGLVFAIFGARILFSKTGIDWMYSQGIWKKDPILSQERERRVRRFAFGGSFFIFGAIMLFSAFVMIYSGF